ncbi:hypothetical protein FGO68_gene11313 [Halteria grandinella]|uniref:Uncharacterized protein n=1 Tax=Halteria grandinella TaxID=5974 RepID=A0A8J8NLX7_HALGN|nr:hypothetical protein FGO68_gene11313 [Halteria grandinella]
MASQKAIALKSTLHQRIVGHGEQDTSLDYIDAEYTLNFDYAKFPREAERAVKMLEMYHPVYKGYIKLLPKHYNTRHMKPGYKRVFCKHTGDLVGFLIPAFDLNDPEAWARCL